MANTGTGRGCSLSGSGQLTLKGGSRVSTDGIGWQGVPFQYGPRHEREQEGVLPSWQLPDLVLVLSGWSGVAGNVQFSVVHSNMMVVNLVQKREAKVFASVR